jgi:O-acetylserine/cysteine efflux transporter
MSNVSPRHLLYLIGITLIWGMNLVVSKVGVSEIPPLLFTTLRFALLAVLTVPFLRVVRGKMSAMVVAALLSGGLNFALMFAGLAIAQNVSSVAIAGQLGVPITTMLSVALLGETVRWRRWTGIALSFAGVLVMGLDPLVFSYWPSLVLVIASAFVGSLGLIAVKRLTEFKPLEMQAWFSWISLPLLVVLTLYVNRPGLAELGAISWKAWGAVAFTAVLGSLVAHTGFYHLVQRYPVTSIAPLTVLSPVFSVVFGVTLLGDQLTPRILAGGFLTLLGVLIITLREKRLTDTGT